MNPYKTPILVNVLRFIAGLHGLFVILFLVFSSYQFEGVPTVAANLFVIFISAVSIILILGIAQVIDFLGKTAYYTQLIAVNSSAPASVSPAYIPAKHTHAPVERSAHGAVIDQNDPDIAAYLKKKADRSSQ